MHFKNVLAPPGWSLCELMRVPEDALTLDPARVTCEPCFARLGRLQDANIGLPTRTKRDG